MPTKRNRKKAIWSYSVAQSCPTLCDPMDCSPLGSSVRGILQARIAGVGCHVLLQGIFLTQRRNLRLLHAGGLSATEPAGKPKQKPADCLPVGPEPRGERRGRVVLQPLVSKPMFVQNHLTRSFLYDKVLNVSCNLLNAELKVKDRMLCGSSMVASALLLLNVKFL